jgi:L-lysine 2,3-aminomutase
VLEVVEQIQTVPHVSAIRLRCLELVTSPDSLTRPAIAKLTAHNRLDVVRPCRLEIETQVLRASELGAAHRAVVRQLSRGGVTVYNNTPLLGYINDHGDEVLSICNACRAAGVEMSHVYIAGLPIQEHWNAEHPIEANSVVDVATHVRRHESGRGVPRYLLRTRLGEVDFSITPRMFFLDRERVRVCLRPHDLDYFRAIDPQFAWPEDVVVDDDGHPLVPIRGVTLTNQEFFLDPLAPRVER